MPTGGRKAGWKLHLPLIAEAELALLEPAAAGQLPDPAEAERRVRRALEDRGAPPQLVSFYAWKARAALELARAAASGGVAREPAERVIRRLRRARLSSLPALLSLLSREGLGWLLPDPETLLGWLRAAGGARAAVLLALADGRARPLPELAGEVATLLGRPIGLRALAARLSELRDLGLVERAAGGWRIKRPF
jgi:hypothetical protein